MKMPKYQTLDIHSKAHYNKPFNFEEPKKRGFTRKPLFDTRHMRFTVYMILPGQVNSLHGHPGSDASLAFTYGKGECVVREEVVPVESGSVLLISTDFPPAVRNTHESDILECTVAESPLPCEHIIVE